MWTSCDEKEGVDGDSEMGVIWSSKLLTRKMMVEAFFLWIRSAGETMEKEITIIKMGDIDLNKSFPWTERSYFNCFGEELVVTLGCRLDA